LEAEALEAKALAWQRAISARPSIFNGEAFPDFIDPLVEGIEPCVKAAVVKIEYVAAGQKSENPVVSFHVNEHLLDRVTDRNNNVPKNVHRILRSKGEDYHDRRVACSGPQLFALAANQSAVVLKSTAQIPGSVAETRIRCRYRATHRTAGQSRSVADLDATDSPTVGRPGPPSDQIATTLVIVTGVSIGVTVSAVGIAIVAVVAIRTTYQAETQTEADAKSGAAKATAPETAKSAAAAKPAAAETTEPAAETATAATETAGLRWSAGCTQQQGRTADEAEGINAEHRDQRQTARQNTAEGLSVLGH
jgi:hypothetical protein